MAHIYEDRNSLRKRDEKSIKEDVLKDAWIALYQYFHGTGNGPEAKLAVVALGAGAKFEQAENNRKALELMYEKSGNRKLLDAKEAKRSA